MIDLDNFYKFEVGVGVEQTMSDVVFLAYALAPNGEKVLRRSRSVDITEWDKQDVMRSALHETMIALFHAIAHTYEELGLHEQSKQE